MRAACLVFAACFLLSAAVPDAAFWKTWGDGQAEISSYDLVKTHYGAPRTGTAVTIFVTETFSNSMRVKADPGKHPKQDEFPVIKLNLVKDFRTGVYDYNDQTSSFLALAGVNGRPAGSLTKISYSSQEWCGNIYHQLLFDPRSIRFSRFSYFDGEGDQSGTLPYPDRGVAEDALWFWARGMAEPKLAPGGTVRAPLLGSLQRVRDRHQALAWSPATFTRSATSSNVTVPAGNFEVETFTVEGGGVKRTFLVERAAPYRIVQWESSDGEKGQLLASTRMKYWELNGPGGESALKQLKLNVRPPRTM